jgi:hypothetical protein
LLVPNPTGPGNHLSVKFNVFSTDASGRRVVANEELCFGVWLASRSAQREVSLSKSEKHGDIPR